MAKLSDKFKKAPVEMAPIDPKERERLEIYYKKIMKKTGLVDKQITELAQVKQNSPEFKGLISFEGSLYLVAKELGIDLKDTDLFDEPEEQPKKQPHAKDFLDNKAKQKLEKELGENIELGNNLFDEPSGTSAPTNATPELKKGSSDIRNKAEPKEAPKIPTSKQVTAKQKELDPNAHYPLQTIEFDKSQLVNLTDAKQHIINQIDLYNFTIKNIVNDNDFANIQGKPHLCKSGVRKIQLALNISTEIIDERYAQTKDGEWVAHYRVRATAPNGRFAEAIGLCEQREKGRDRTLHDTLATAQTRASSRAIMDLVGFGQVTSGEIDDEWI